MAYFFSMKFLNFLKKVILAFWLFYSSILLTSFHWIVNKGFQWDSDQDLIYALESDLSINSSIIEPTSFISKNSMISLTGFDYEERYFLA